MTIRAETRSAPHISVVIPVYNHGLFVADAIQSVLNQTMPATEIIVVDDGSTDNSAAVVGSIAREHSRIKLICQPNQGSAAAINKGISLAQGSWLTILNSDDRWHPKRLEKIITYATRHGCNFCLSGTRLIDSHGALIRDPRHPWNLMYKQILDELSRHGIRNAFCLSNPAISTSNFVLTRDLFQIVGQFRNFRFVPDWDWALRAVSNGACSPEWIKAPLLDYRIHSNNTIGQSGLRSSIEILRMLGNRQQAASDQALLIERARRHFFRDVRAHVHRAGFASGLRTSDQAHSEERQTARTVILQLEHERDEARAHAEKSQQQRDQDLATMQLALERAAAQRDQDLAHMREALQQADQQRGLDLATLRDAYEAQVLQLEQTLQNERQVSAAAREQLEHERDEARAHAIRTYAQRDQDLAKMQQTLESVVTQSEVDLSEAKQRYERLTNQKVVELETQRSLLDETREVHRQAIEQMTVALEHQKATAMRELREQELAYKLEREDAEKRHLHLLSELQSEKSTSIAMLTELRGKLEEETQIRDLEINRLRVAISAEQKRWLGLPLRRALRLK